MLKPGSWLPLTQDWSTARSVAPCSIFPAPFGGPVALVRDDKKVLLFRGTSARPDVAICSAAGRPLGRVLWEGPRLVAAGWTADERLVAVDERGSVRLHSVRGERLPQHFSLGPEVEGEGVEEAHVFAGGLVVLTPSRGLWALPSLDVPRLVRLPDVAPPGAALHCMAALPPGRSPSGGLEVLAAVDAGVWVVHAAAGTALPSSIAQGPILALAPSPCGRYVAGWAQDGTLHVWTTDLMGGGRGWGRGGHALPPAQPQRQR